LKHNKVIEERRREHFAVEVLFKDSTTELRPELISQMKSRIVDTVPKPINYHCEYSKDYV
jgi:hypothetical protein